jgi:hypothetical protein
MQAASSATVVCCRTNASGGLWRMFVRSEVKEGGGRRPPEGHERSTNIRHSPPDALNFATTHRQARMTKTDLIQFFQPDFCNAPHNTGQRFDLLQRSDNILLLRLMRQHDDIGLHFTLARLFLQHRIDRNR